MFFYEFWEILKFFVEQLQMTVSQCQLFKLLQKRLWYSCFFMNFEKCMTAWLLLFNSTHQSPITVSLKRKEIHLLIVTKQISNWHLFQFLILIKHVFYVMQCRTQSLYNIVWKMNPNPRSCFPNTPTLKSICNSWGNWFTRLLC